VSRPFDRLSCADLRTLAAAAGAGRLVRPYSALSLGRLLDSGVARETAEELERLGLTPDVVGSTLSLLADEREATGSRAGSVELVWTGPELPGMGSRDTAVVVRELFASAESTLLVSGFAVHGGKDVFEPLARRLQEIPTLRVRLFLNIARPQGSRDSEQEIVRDFVSQFHEKQWPNDRSPEIYYDPRALEEDYRTRAVLHAKCIVVDDRRVFVTSANLTTAAQEKNIEAGLLVSDVGLARSLRMQFDSLVSAGILRLAARAENG
jgi:phosphatidylserine/phosphatidylglycerophosphate/cardiolipin synthase-like enzyme